MNEKKNNMEELSLRDRELVAIGAAIASNCVPCIEYHIPQARKAGLSDPQISEAVALADKVRRVPAEKVLQTACALMELEKPVEPDAEAVPCGCTDTGAVSEESAGCGERVVLDNPSSKEDNRMS